MSEHHAGIRWARQTVGFAYETYNRTHEMRFKDGAISLPASAAPAFRGDADRVDPEEAYVASLSSCHMLTLLAICARKRLTVDSYEDDAVGFLEKGPDGKLWMARVILRPRVQFAPQTEVQDILLNQIHELSHHECFIASSVRTDVIVEARL